MKALIYKDGITFLWAFVALVGLVALPLIVGTTLGVKLDFLLAWTAGMVFMACTAGGLSMHVADLKAHTDRYLQAAPLRKSLIVLERYLWGWILSVIATVLVVGSLHPLSQEKGSDFPLFLVVVLFFFVVTAMFAFTTPFAYLLGPEMAFLPFFVLCMVLGVPLVVLAARVEDDRQVQQFFTAVIDNSTVIAWVVLIATIVLNVASYYASVGIYRRKIN